MKVKLKLLTKEQFLINCFLTNSRDRNYDHYVSYYNELEMKDHIFEVHKTDIHPGNWYADEECIYSEYDLIFIDKIKIDILLEKYL